MEDNAPLRVVMINFGSTGDLQPFASLGWALQQRGHIVTIVAQERFRTFMEALGLAYCPVPGDITEAVSEKQKKGGLQEGGLNEVRALLRNTQEIFQNAENYAMLEKVCDGADVIVGGPTVLNQTFCLAEKFKTVWIPLFLGPYLKTNEFPMFAFGFKSFPFKWLNSASFQFISWLMWKLDKEVINKWRKETLNLPSMSGPAAKLVSRNQFYSITALAHHVIPGAKRPTDWPSKSHLTGFIFSPPGLFPLDPELERFVLAGESPVYIGFGSMVVPDSIDLVSIAKHVRSELGVRLVLAAGWTEIHGDGSEDVFIIKSVPQDWLFPRCACIVHHGGVGTTGAVLQSGTPSVVVPFAVDQPFYAHQLSRVLKVSPDPIPLKILSAATLTKAIRTALGSEEIRANAKRVANEIKEMGGAVGAAEVVEKAANENRNWGKGISIVASEQ